MSSAQRPAPAGASSRRQAAACHVMRHACTTHPIGVAHAVRLMNQHSAAWALQCPLGSQATLGRLITLSETRQHPRPPRPASRSRPGGAMRADTTPRKQLHSKWAGRGRRAGGRARGAHANTHMTIGKNAHAVDSVSPAVAGHQAPAAGSRGTCCPSIPGKASMGRLWRPHQWWGEHEPTSWGAAQPHAAGGR
jgi:hypothetical protein